MPIPKRLLAGFVAATLALGGGAVIAHELIDNPSSAVGPQTTASARPISADLDARQIYDASKNAVTYIVADTPQGQATGSGFVVSKDGLIVTNDHVVDGATRVQVKVGTNGKAQDATVVGADASRDLALLKVDGGNLSTLSLGDSSSVGVGDAVYAIGNPFGLDRTMTAGIVSATGRDIQAPNGLTIPSAIQTDAPINHGNSGGPLLDRFGRVVGINSQIEGGTVDANVGIGFAIPSDTVRDLAQQIIQHGKVVNSHRAYLGIRVGAAGNGLYVGSVTAGGPAANAGIQDGDVIMSVDGEPTATTGVLSEVLAELKPGQKVDVEVVHQSGTRSTLQVTLGTYPGS